MASRTRSHLSFSNVVAVMALFAALGGGAYAAGLIGSDGVVYACAKKKNGDARIVKKGKKCKSTERAVKWSQTGPQGEKGAAGAAGATGAAGAAGTNGTNGAAGANGADGFGLTSGLAFVFNAATRFAPPMNTASSAPTEAAAQVLSPNRAITISEFYADLDSTPGGGGTVTLQFSVDGVPTGPVCTITDDTVPCSPSGTVVVPARSRLAIKIVSTGSATPYVAWSFTIA